MKFWKKYMISDENLISRKKYLIDYMNKQGASFLGERDVFVRKNDYKNEKTMTNYFDRYFRYSNYFNRLFSELKLNLIPLKRTIC